MTMSEVHRAKWSEAVLAGTTCQSCRFVRVINGVALREAGARRRQVQGTASVEDVRQVRALGEGIPMTDAERADAAEKMLRGECCSTCAHALYRHLAETNVASKFIACSNSGRGTSAFWHDADFTCENWEAIS